MPAAAFDRAMLRLYEDARDAGYNATYFLRMLNELGGVATAKRLINANAPSEGFTKLWEMKRLDLSVEALVRLPQWRDLQRQRIGHRTASPGRVRIPHSTLTGL